MTDFTEILAENQMELLQLIAPSVKNFSNLSNLGDSDSEAENSFIAPTATSIKTKKAVAKNTPLVIRTIGPSGEDTVAHRIQQICIFKVLNF